MREPPPPRHGPWHTLLQEWDGARTRAGQKKANRGVEKAKEAAAKRLWQYCSRQDRIAKVLAKTMSTTTLGRCDRHQRLVEWEPTWVTAYQLEMAEALGYTTVSRAPITAAAAERAKADSCAYCADSATSGGKAQTHTDADTASGWSTICAISRRGGSRRAKAP